MEEEAVPSQALSDAWMPNLSELGRPGARALALQGHRQGLKMTKKKLSPRESWLGEKFP